MSLKAFELVPVIEDFGGDKQKTVVKMGIFSLIVISARDWMSVD